MKGLLAEIKNRGSNNLSPTSTTVRHKDGTISEENMVNGVWVQSEVGRDAPVSSQIARSERTSVELRPLEAHGVLGADRQWPKPTLAVHCEHAVRADQGNYTAAHEFADTAEVLREKIRLLAQLVQRSRATCVYAGAGLSRASGIGDYATKAKHSMATTSSSSRPVPVLISPLHAMPTLAHRALASMFAEDNLTVNEFVQQNHDGLPQKSGIPQRCINEIHGAWFDPSNPVVKFNGSLRSDLFERLQQTVARTDLCLVVGTSLSGMSADQCATQTAKRMKQGDAIGTVIINLQRTPVDDESCLRIWAPLDDAMSMLADELGLQIKPDTFGCYGEKEADVFNVPYDAEGRVNQTCSQTLDLSVNSTLVISHPDSVHFGCDARVLSKDHWGNYQIEVQAKEFPKVRRYMLGKWWRETLINGDEEYMPLKNK